MRADLDQILAASERGATLVRQLLTFSRRQRTEPVLLDPNGVVEDLTPLLQRVIGEHIRLTVDLASRGHVLADPGQMEQVLVNLAANARDAMPDGGHLTIETADTNLEAAYVALHPESGAGPHVVIAVSDTGIGIDEPTRARMFEPFFTTKGPDRGTGLGLATVHGIVEQAGGHIEVYSEVARGTTFRVYLPTVASDVLLARERVSTAPPGGSETILLVEDDDAVRALGVRALAGLGYRVLEASCPDDALRRDFGELAGVDLLLTDVVMPGRSGPELASILTELIPNLPVICTSGYAEKAVLDHGDGHFARNYLAKPYTVDGLARKVREVLDAHRREACQPVPTTSRMTRGRSGRRTARRGTGSLNGAGRPR